MIDQVTITKWVAAIVSGIIIALQGFSMHKEQRIESEQKELEQEVTEWQKAQVAKLDEILQLERQRHNEGH
jgi:hypothetical protein